MASIAEQLADLDRRIAYLEQSAADLRQEIAALDPSSRQYLKLHGLLQVGERTIVTLRAQRAALQQRNSG